MIFEEKKELPTIDDIIVKTKNEKKSEDTFERRLTSKTAAPLFVKLERYEEIMEAVERMREAVERMREAFETFEKNFKKIEHVFRKEESKEELKEIESLMSPLDVLREKKEIKFE